jgi:DNA helicase TIP49 (TBP-interacting protein)
MDGRHFVQLLIEQRHKKKYMELTKQKVQDKIEIVSEHKHIQIRYAIQILEGGLVISSTFERDVINCGDWDKAGEHNLTSLASAIWTKEIIDSFLQLKNQNQTQDENHA